jgi:predicted Fe-Mo cluster-binding NifX family protein
MKVAIPLYGDCVSPKFGAAPEVLIIVSQGRTIGSTLKFDFSNLSLTEKRLKLIAFGVNTIICDAIDENTLEWLENRGIQVINNVTGEAIESFKNYMIEQQDKELKLKPKSKQPRGYNSSHRNN